MVGGCFGAHRSGAGRTAEGRVASCSVKPLFRRKRPSLPRRVRWDPPVGLTEGPWRSAPMLARQHPDQGLSFLLQVRRAKPASALACATTMAACPFGHWMRRRGQRGRWPARWSYPPGGGCEFGAGTPWHPASQSRRRHIGTGRGATDGAGQDCIPARAFGWSRLRCVGRARAGLERPGALRLSRHRMCARWNA